MADRPPKLGAKVRLVADDGVGAVRIVTTTALETMHSRRSVGYVHPWDREAIAAGAQPGRIWEEVVTPLEELLQGPGTYQFSARKAPGAELWRTLQLDISVAQTPRYIDQRNWFSRWLSVRRIIDLWEGSEERRAVELMCEQDEVRLQFVNEDKVIVHRVTDHNREVWREALKATRGMTKAAWREELLEVAWRSSEGWIPGRPRPKRHKRRTATPPAAPVPFFAGRSGAIPSARRPNVAGEPLPRGRRYPSGLPAAYWCSDEPTADVQALAQKLADAFPDTGLWPLLWRSDEDPDSYMGGHGDIDEIDSIDVAAKLGQMWRQHNFTEPQVEPYKEFPGLAATVASCRGSGPFDHLNDTEPARLLLVPCNRPADAITMLGGLACKIEPAVISAVLRSWEQRARATVREVEPSLAILSVDAQPNDGAALRLAAEYLAFCPPAPPDEHTVRGIAKSLTPAGVAKEPKTWRVGWYD